MTNSNLMSIYLTEDDYKLIWGSEEEYASALTPKTVIQYEYQ